MRESNIINLSTHSWFELSIITHICHNVATCRKRKSLNYEKKCDD